MLRKTSIAVGVVLALPLGAIIASTGPGSVFNLNGTDTGITGVTAIASGSDFEVVLRSDGTVQSYNNSLIVDNQPVGLTDVKAISAGGTFALALRNDGTVVGWGGRGAFGAQVPNGLTGVVAISAGYNNGFALRNDGTVTVWGVNPYGYQTPPAGLDNVVAISAGLDYNLALRSDGTVTGWGRGTSTIAVPAGLRNVVSISACLVRQQFAAIRSDGTVIGWGYHYDGGKIIPGITDAVAVVAQNGGGVVLRSNGTLTGWTVSLFGKITTVSYPSTLNRIEAITSRLALKAGSGAFIGGSALNISSRLNVQRADNILIGGFIIAGTQPKKVILRAIGPSLSIPNKLKNPTLDLYGPNGLISSNDNWRSRQEAAIIASTIAPTNDWESAIVATLPANNTGYTAIVRGVAESVGIGLIEIYDLDPTANSRLANISTRGRVQTADNVLIGGFILNGRNAQRVIVRAIGPSLPVAGKLTDPTLELRDGNGLLLARNDNWRSDQEADIVASTVPPINDLESAIVATLVANNSGYSAIVRGANGEIGIGLIEVYTLN